MKDILATYEEATGQAINFLKFEFYCSRNVDFDTRIELATLLGVQQVLGTGRETMIKYVLQSIPTYIMSLFLLPSSLIDEIEKMMNRLWWGHKRDRAKGIHWLSWDRLSMPKSEGGKGFKNISAFNLAMLSKQAWRLTTNSDSLVAPYGAQNFVIKGGLKWSIGSGENISVWDSFWLFDGTSLTNPWPNNLVVDNLKVSDLMSPNGKHWNQSVIHSLVGEEAAEKIQNTPLFTVVQNDSLFWKHESNGKFSVQSAYRYCINDAIDTSHLRISERWNLLWNIRTPPRVSSKDQQATFSVILWSIWKGRNNLVWNQVEDSSTIICQRALQLLTGWREAQQLHPNNGIINPPSTNIRWLKPSRGRLKCNIDASFFHNKVGIGACIRDDTGQFIVARTEWFSPCTDVAIGEALGLLKTLNWVHELGFDNMNFELDAKRVVDSVTNPKPNDSDFGAITGECNRLMALFFRNSHVEFVRRQANEVAHALARNLEIHDNLKHTNSSKASMPI
ncbi:uncharacterized protein LOC131650592 [Vicia villosa]|uniref:uncharacterized protein LOC131650592 n=1 Tax=Vicia villosa TaxID=3911 RepID=UPI00273ACFEA|nr:uncharacterized protein LOC131650592 [Vicia villosa]